MPNVNLIWANIVAEELYRSGVRTICISPGSRSTPLVLAFAAYREIYPDLELLVHIDERSAGFFALGLAKVTRQAVALVCTSGTAAANYYPAIIEAFYSEVPLIVLTADRPPELRDCGAGQTIDQIHMYGSHLRYFFEVGTPDFSELNLEFKLRYLRSLISHSVSVARGEAFTLAGAVHLNFAFADPLIPSSYPLADVSRTDRSSHIQTIKAKNILSERAIAQIANQITNTPKGIIVVGVYDPELKSEFENAVKALSLITSYPLFAEATGMNRQGVIGCYDSFLRSPSFSPSSESTQPDLVIRFGAMPTSKTYQLWLKNYTKQIIIGNGKNTDPTHGLAQIINVDSISFCQDLTNYLQINNYQNQDSNWNQYFENIELITKAAIAQFLSKIDDLFDGKVYSELAKWLPDRTHLYVANSSAIRDLDSFFHSDRANPVSIPILVNRGANGIDGTLSSALGAAWGCDRPMILICGDLAFYHDLNGLMAVKKYNIKLTVILLNNDGGGIFEMLPISKINPPFEEFFGTAHGLDFAPIVRAYGCDYIKVKDWQHFQEAVLTSIQTDGTQILEIKSDRSQNKHLHQQFWEFIIAAITATRTKVNTPH